MKSMSNDDNNSNTNWLGFSLSPNMKMEVSNQEAHRYAQSASASVAAAGATTAVPSSFFQSPSHLNYGLYYGVEGENGGWYSHFPAMPLKSDGSLCLMEALGRFFGGATMGTHHYESSDRETMALSLDSMYYHHQNPGQEHNNQNCLDHLQQSSRQLHHQQQLEAQQQYPYYYGYRNQEMLLGEEAKETQVTDCNLQAPTVTDDGAPGMKDWVSRNYSTEHAMHKKMIGCMGDNGAEWLYCCNSIWRLQPLSLSMSPGSQSSCVTGSQQISPSATDYAVSMETKKRGPEKVDQKQIIHRKSIDTFGQRSSQYRGVTRHRWTGRYEAHLWDNSCKKEGQSRKGRQGGYDMEEKAAKAYDLAALKYWGPSTHINFPLENYQKELEEMKNMTRQEYVAHLRRHHQHGRWQARIGRVAGNKDLYLGTFSTQEEAAEAYDIAAIKFRGVNAVTNFDITRYDVERIMASNTLLAAELARRNKDIGPSNETINHNLLNDNINGETNNIPQNNNGVQPEWKMALYQSSDQQLEMKQPNIIENYKTQAFPLAPETMIAVDTISSSHREVDESSKMGTHLSNTSSLVTSLSSSKEGSPDRNSLPMVFPMPPPASKLFTSSGNTVNSWIPSAQLRPAISVPQMPVIAAWTDA
ncbi:AP2-like ethylene-responsive transcription factor PLT1 [Hibiscus syriacus]|uniref:AP2-like ethylene-responsive transcription factor PLT1 n=1 Tax=Hibiscus syriacus TaxID=106335 RepID=A0A6A3ALT9_HIBSY|nr:AP2-like ethylene-responsive transcription factor PLT1 [Hibiscus syriacus]